MCSQLCFECLCPSPLKMLQLKPNHQLGPNHRLLLNVSSALKGSHRELPCHLIPTEGSTKGYTWDLASALTLNFQPLDCKFLWVTSPLVYGFVLKQFLSRRVMASLGEKRRKQNKKAMLKGRKMAVLVRSVQVTRGELVSNPKPNQTKTNCLK